jgi:uncharacterized membrane protein
MKKLQSFLKKYRYQVILSTLVIVYALFFSIFTISRANDLHANYFDLGIMNQTTYNSYKALQTGDFSRIL